MVQNREAVELRTRIRELELRLDGARREQDSNRREQLLTEEVESLRREVQAAWTYALSVERQLNERTGSAPPS